MNKIENKYIELFTDYIARIKEEKLSDEGNCSISIKVSDTSAIAIIDISADTVVKENSYKEINFNETLSGELEIHRTIFLKNKDANAIIHAMPHNANIVGKLNIKSFPTLLDDTAQIVGISTKISSNYAKVLKRRTACVVPNGGIIACGSSLYSAYVATLVQEKACKCFIDVTVIGQYKKIPTLEALLMNFIYKKKYSKVNDDFAVTKKEGIINCSDKEMELRVAVKEAGVKLVQSNLVQGTWGNISIRIDDKHMLITPSGIDYLTLKPEDMVVMNMETKEYEGNIKPSGEKDIHMGILLSRPDINVVMHSHPSECSSFAAAHKSMPVISEDMHKYVGGAAEISKYGLPSTKSLAASTVEAMQGRNACFMANHGMLAVGATIEDTFRTCSVMEESARAYLKQLAGGKTREEIAKARYFFS